MSQLTYQWYSILKKISGGQEPFFQKEAPVF
jgi:hypothetical protein